MKRILTSTALILFLALSGLLFPASPSGAADELIFDTFDNWKNPFVAEGWGTHSFGGWGGECNQIYEAGQEMTSLQGDSSYFRSVYKDFPATPGNYYSVSFEPAGGQWLNLDRNPSRVWLQFDDKDGNVLSTQGGLAGIEYAGERKYYVPGLWVSFYWRRQGALAPLGTDHMRVIFQTLAGQGAAAFGKVIVYEAFPVREVELNLVDRYTFFSFTPIGGPYISRNTEFAAEVARDWTSYTFGDLPGRYGLKAAGGSAQGISCGGTFENYRSVFRDFKVTPGVKYRVSVDVTSNSTNFLGTRDPSPVRVWIQYNGIAYDGKERVLSTHGLDGTQAGVNDNEWTTATIPGPNKEPYTVAPENTNRARIILQVMGGTGGGTIFDDVSFARAGD